MDGVGVSVLLEHLHRHGVLVAADEQVDVAVGAVADVGVEGGDGLEPPSPATSARRRRRLEPAG